MNEVNDKKEAIIAKLKEDTLSDLENDFVENYEFCKARMEFINSIISQVDKSAKTFEYNEFCKSSSNIIKKVLDNEIDYENLFLTEDEFRKLEKENDYHNLDESVACELKKKFDKYLLDITMKRLILETVKQKLGDKYQNIEKELEKSAGLAIIMLKKK